MLVPVLLSLLGVAAILAEFFIPSAGLIGIGGAGVIIVGVIRVFRAYGSLAGFIFLCVNALIVPGMIFLYWKHFPRSFMGRRLILSGPSEGDKQPAGGPGQEALLVGTEGIAASFLRPAGTGLFGDTRISVISDGEFLAQGSPIRIVRIEGNRILVEAVSAAERGDARDEA